MELFAIIFNSQKFFLNFVYFYVDRENLFKVSNQGNKKSIGGVHNQFPVILEH